LSLGFVGVRPREYRWLLGFSGRSFPHDGSRLRREPSME
jgi:hypothetical protein